MADYLLQEDSSKLLLEDGSGFIILDGFTSIVATPNAVLNPINGVGKSNRDKYTWQIFVNNKLFADLTGLAQDRQFVKTRNASDEITFSMNLDALEDYARSNGVNTQDILQAGISEIRVSRYGVVLSAGWLKEWDAELNEERKVTLTFLGWRELLKYRLVTQTYANFTALQIIQDVINGTQAKSFGSFGFVFGSVPTSDLTNLYATKDYKDKTIFDILDELEKDENGIDTEFTWDKKINVYYPKQGIQREDIVFSYPGTIQDIQVSNDATKIVNSLTVRGAGYGPAQLIQSVTDSLSQQKYGLREGTIDYPDITDTTQLLNLGTSENSLFRIPLVLHTIKLDGTQDPQVGSFNIGDSVRIAVSQVLKLYSGINNFFRVDSYQVNLGNEGEETITVQVN